MRSDNMSGSIADRSNFMSDCKQMQARLENGKYFNLKRKNCQVNMLQNSSRNSVPVKFSFLCDVQ